MVLSYFCTYLKDIFSNYSLLAETDSGLRHSLSILEQISDAEASTW